jgi:hypothetical protein
LETFSVVVIVIVRDWELFLSSWSWSCVIRHFLRDRDRDQKYQSRKTLLRSVLCSKIKLFLMNSIALFQLNYGI